MVKTGKNDYEKQLQRTYERYRRDEISAEDIPPGLLSAIIRMLQEELRINRQIVKDTDRFLRKAEGIILADNIMPKENFVESFDPENFMNEFRTAIEDEAANNGNIEIKSGIKKITEEEMTSALSAEGTEDTTETFNFALFDE